MKILDHIKERTVLETQDEMVAYLNSHYTPDHSRNFLQWVCAESFDDVEIEEIVNFNDFSTSNYNRGNLYKLIVQGREIDAWYFLSTGDPMLITEKSELCTTCYGIDELLGLARALDIDTEDLSELECIGATINLIDGTLEFVGSRGNESIELTCEVEELNQPARWCVVLKPEFKNQGNFKFFYDHAEAECYAQKNSGDVVDQDELANEFEAMHKASGRIPNQAYNERFVEYPSELELENLGLSEDEWMENYWQQEYLAASKYAFENATVYTVKYKLEQ